MVTSFLWTTSREMLLQSNITQGNSYHSDEKRISYIFSHHLIQLTSLLTLPHSLLHPLYLKLMLVLKDIFSQFKEGSSPLCSYNRSNKQTPQDKQPDQMSKEEIKAQILSKESICSVAVESLPGASSKCSCLLKARRQDRFSCFPYSYSHSRGEAEKQGESVCANPR